MPRHDHSGVQSPGQRHPDRLSRFEISREVSRKHLADLPVVCFRLQEALVLPLPGFEVCSPHLDGTGPEDPRRSTRQHANAREERPIFQDTAAGDPLPQSLGVRPPELGPHRQDRLRFRGEIEGVLRLVIVDPVHPVPIVEQRRRSTRPVRQESVEPSVQSRRKGMVILVEVDEIGGALRVEVMPTLLEAARRTRLGELLP